MERLSFQERAGRSRVESVESKENLTWVQLDGLYDAAVAKGTLVKREHHGREYYSLPIPKWKVPIYEALLEEHPEWGMKVVRGK